MTKSSKLFILVDDDQICNMIAKRTICQSLESVKEVEVEVFSDPEMALNYIETDLSIDQHDEKIVIFLDINMPILSGWDFLDKFSAFSASIKKQFDIYMVSSSVDHADVQQAHQHPLVIDFIEKPLNKTKIREIFN